MYFIEHVDTEPEYPQIQKLTAPKYLLAFKVHLKIPTVTNGLFFVSMKICRGVPQKGVIQTISPRGLINCISSGCRYQFRDKNSRKMAKTMHLYISLNKLLIITYMFGSTPILHR